jgi:hypothetical protein
MAGVQRASTSVTGTRRFQIVRSEADGILRASFRPVHLEAIKLVRTFTICACAQNQTSSLPDGGPRSNRFRCGGRECNF